ncbi:MAG: ectonucleotide pyrophosphatase/phosphodiesterase, partial [Gammaproteobacteria bacterium]|nr:ectonucleotide pyrophosphatase/phosphodiesterase [Gammaproteobacteria bacterium]
ASRESTVILLSWDGLRHDFPDKGNFPGLLRMEQTGVRANRLIPVFPSNTFPGHVSIATGTYPDRHGIVDNHFFAREEASWYHMSSDADWIQAEPLWIAAERQGVSTATYFWVGSESDWHGQGTRYRIAPFDGRRPEHKKVDQILAWLHLPEAERPRLIMSYWAGADSVAHRHGPDSPEVVTQLTLQDVQLQRLLAGLDALDCWAMTTLILVSDHGMATNSQFIDLTKVFADANIEVEVVGVNPAHVFVEDQNLSNRAGSVLRKLDRVTVYRGLEFPAEMRLGFPDRIGDWVVVTEPPYSFARLAPGSVMGMHGYNPLLDEMGASFLALGRGIASDLEIADVHQIDVAATVTLLLGIDPPLHSEGRAIPGIGVRTLSDVESCQ